MLDNGTLSPNAHPWALQLKADLQSLKDIEPGREFIQGWKGNMRKLVMDDDCRTRFCDIDLGELRMRALYDANCSVWQSAHLRDHVEKDTDCSFKCSFTSKSDTRCQFYSTTRRGLISHMVKAHCFLRSCAASCDYKRMPLVSFNFLYTTGCSTSRVLVIPARFLPRRRKQCTNRNQAAIVACCLPAV